MGNIKGIKNKDKKFKLDVIEFYSNHSVEQTIKKFNVSKSSIHRWQKQYDNNESLVSRSGDHCKTVQHKEKIRNAKFFSPNKDLSTLSREELQEYAEFWVTVGKWQQDLKKKK